MLRTFRNGDDQDIDAHKDAHVETNGVIDEADEQDVDSHKDAHVETSGATDEVDFTREKKKKELRNTDYEGFPDWPLPSTMTLYDDQIGSPRCHSTELSCRRVLHQTSKPKRHPSVEEVEMTLPNLPTWTRHVWHSDEDICDFVRAHPLRF